jgi:hypothetical protein
MDAHQISAARLISQGLVGPTPPSPTGSRLSAPATVVEHLGCVQAQALGGALASVALRLSPEAGTGMDAVRAAIDAGDIVRSWTQRGTIHLTTAKDLGWILSLTGERTMRATAKRREYFGITDAMLAQAEELATTAIRERGPLTREELLEVFAPIGAGDEYGHARYLITSLALTDIIVQAPLIEGKDDMRYVLASDWIPTPTELDAEAALHEWMRRFVTSHGPVTIDDAARWTGLPKTPVMKAIAAAVDAGEIVDTRIDDTDYVQAPDLDDRLSEWEAAAYETMLLPGFDEMILGYKDRSATLTPEDEKLVVPGGNGMFKNTVLTGTKAAGTWKRSPRKTGPRVLTEAFPGTLIDSDAVEMAAANHPSFE